MEALVGAPGEGPGKGLLGDFEIFANLSLKIPVISLTDTGRQQPGLLDQGRGVAGEGGGGGGEGVHGAAVTGRTAPSCPHAADTGIIDPEPGTGTPRPAPAGEISTIC